MGEDFLPHLLLRMKMDAKDAPGSAATLLVWENELD
jgi:hypothetical protein